MIRKRILLLISAILTSTLYVSAIGDSTNIDNLVPYTWTPISDIENILQYEDTDNMSKRTPQLLQKAKPFYEKGFEKMQNKEYSAAVGQFNIAMKEYKKAGADHFSVSTIFFYPFKTFSFFSDIYF